MNNEKFLFVPLGLSNMAVDDYKKVVPTDHVVPFVENDFLYGIDLVRWSSGQEPTHDEIMDALLLATFLPSSDFGAARASVSGVILISDPAAHPLSFSAIHGWKEATGVHVFTPAVFNIKTVV